MKQLLAIILSIGLSVSFVSAQNQDLPDMLSTVQSGTENTDLVEVLKPNNPVISTQTIIETLTNNQSDYQLTRASSCEQLQSVFIQRSKDLPQYGYPYPMYASDDMMVDSAVETSAPSKLANTQGLTSQTSVESDGQGGMQLGMSTTNTQVQGVDEPDIVKQDDTAVYYINSDTNTVQIFPHNKYTGRGNVSSTIVLPKTMYGSMLMLYNKQLVVIGSYYEENQQQQTSIIDSSSSTVIAIYDVSNIKTPLLVKHYRAPGYYQDVRLHSNKLTVVSQLGLNLYGLSDSDIATGSVTNTGTSNTNTKISADSIMPYWGYNPKPSSLKNDAGLTNVALDCTDVWYPAIASGTAINDQSMTSILTIDLNNPQASKATLIAGNTQTVYMSTNRLYLIGNQYVNDTSAVCEANTNCIWNQGSSYTQITSLDPITMTKPIVTRVLGYPLGQYAYHENSTGEFNLITQGNEQSTNEITTHVWTLQPNGKISGALMDIQPGEQFKSSRYIGDKLYMVTFEQIDPLFVIDLSATTPRILGELKIPGYSTYLHPYGDMNGKTYLIGLGYDVDNSNGRTVNSGVKLDLYEIDYNKITNGNISVKQVQSNKIGGPGTESEALYNPRMFVYDEANKTVYLPLVRTVQDKVTYCPQYSQLASSSDQNMILARRNDQCYDNYQDRILFAGYKGVSISPQAITQTKIVDYTWYYWWYSKDKGEDQLYPWQIQNLGTRVGYYNNQVWFVNNWFMRTQLK